MKTAESERFLQVSGDFQTVDFGIQRQNMRHLMGILRDQLYSDKILAPIREYSCNAYDANVENGKKDVPIRVTFPTSMFPEFRIRDEGKGLSYHEMVNIFCSYGESTKRNSNEYIGQLGIGSKSAFAYGDNFLVSSYKDGKKTTYNCVLDNSGIGTLILLTEEDSNEPSGLEILIPVIENDFNSFIEKGLNFFKFWKVTPTIHGLDGAVISRYVDSNVNVIWSGENWECRTPTALTRNIHIIVMGNISYPIDWNLVYSYYDLNYNYNEIIQLLRPNTLIINANIGDIDMSPSRESLQYTPKTISYLKSIIENIKSNLEDNFTKSISTAKNLYEAKGLFYKTFRGSEIDRLDYQTRSVYHNLYCKYKETFKWNGILIKGESFDGLNKWTSDGLDKKSPLIFPLNICTSISLNKSKLSIQPVSQIYCYSFLKNLIVINDVDVSHDFYRRIKNRKVFRWLLQYKTKEEIEKLTNGFVKDAVSIQNLLVLNFSNDDVKKEFYKNYDFDTVPVVKMSELFSAFQVESEQKKKSMPEKSVTSLEEGQRQISYIDIHAPYTVKSEIIDMEELSGQYIKVDGKKYIHENGVSVYVHDAILKIATLNKTFSFLESTKIYLFGKRIQNSKKIDIGEWTDVVSLMRQKIDTTNLFEQHIYASALSQAKTEYAEKAVYLNPVVYSNICKNIAAVNNDSKFLGLSKIINEDSRNYSTISLEMHNALAYFDIGNLSENNGEIEKIRFEILAAYREISAAYPLLSCIKKSHFLEPETSDEFKNAIKFAQDYINDVDNKA